MRDSNPMRAEAMIEQVRRAFADKLFISVASPDVDLLETGVMDSLTLVNLIAELEQIFCVDILQHDFEIDRFRSLRSIVAFIDECLPASNTAAGE